MNPFSEIQEADNSDLGGVFLQMISLVTNLSLCLLKQVWYVLSFFSLDKEFMT